MTFRNRLWLALLVMLVTLPLTALLGYYIYIQVEVANINKEITRLTAEACAHNQPHLRPCK